MNTVKDVVFMICAITGALVILINVVALAISVWAKRILKTLKQIEDNQGQHTQD